MTAQLPLFVDAGLYGRTMRNKAETRSPISREWAACLLNYMFLSDSADEERSASF